MARKMKVCTITTSNDVDPNASNPLTLIGIEKTPTPAIYLQKKTQKSAEIFPSVGDDSSISCCTVKIHKNSQNIFLTCNLLCICPRLYPNFH
jgi:hypothetical protein